MVDERARCQVRCDGFNHGPTFYRNFLHEIGGPPPKSTSTKRKRAIGQSKAFFLAAKGCRFTPAPCRRRRRWRPSGEKGLTLAGRAARLALGLIVERHGASWQHQRPNVEFDRAGLPFPEPALRAACFCSALGCAGAIFARIGAAAAGLAAAGLAADLAAGLPASVDFAAGYSISPVAVPPSWRQRLCASLSWVSPYLAA